MKRVYKYATGQDIPEDAVYLSTKCLPIKKETRATHEGTVITKDMRIWHYFLVEVEE